MTQKTFKQLREELKLSGTGKGGTLVYLDEASLSRIHQHLQDRNIGTITAHRAEHTAEENVARNRQLESDIRAHGFGFHHVDGAYVENHGTPQARNVLERSYVVVGSKGDDGGKLKNFLKTHGEKYQQDSVLHKAHNETDAKLIGTKKEGSWPAYGKEESVGTWHPNKAAEFHSIITKVGKKPREGNPLKKGRTDKAPLKVYSFTESEEYVYEELGITENQGSGFFGEYGRFIAEKAGKPE